MNKCVFCINKDARYGTTFPVLGTIWLCSSHHDVLLKKGPRQQEYIDRLYAMYHHKTPISMRVRT